MNIDISTFIGTIFAFSIVNLIFGYVIGRFGITAIENDLSYLKGIISGQDKITISAPGNLTTSPAVVTVNGSAA